MSMMFFHFFKIIFDINTSKQSKKYKPHSILAKKKLKFDQTQIQPQSQTGSKSKEYMRNRLLNNDVIMIVLFQRNLKHNYKSWDEVDSR